MPEYNAAILLDENDARKLQVEEEALETDATLVRFWTKIPRKHVQALADVLTARRKETNPKADTQVYSGTYRIQRVTHKIEGNMAILYEHLALGFFTDIETEANARFVSYEVDPRDSLVTMERRWPYMDPKAVDGILTTAPATTATITDPKMDGETYSGTFATVARAQKERDGSISIVQTLTQVVVKAGASFELSDLPTPLKVQHPYDEFDPHAFGHAYNESITYTYRGLDPTDRDDIEALTRANWMTKFVETTVNDDTTWTYMNHEITLQQDNSLQVSVRGGAVLGEAYADVARTVQSSEFSTISETEKKSQTQTAAGTALFGSKGTLSWQRNPKTNLYDYRVRKQSAATGLSGSNVYVLRSQRFVDQAITKAGGVITNITNLYLWEQHTVTQQSSMADAISNINGGHQRSSYWKMADGAWIADKVDATVAATSPY